MPNHDRFECQTAIDSDAILQQRPPEPPDNFGDLRKAVDRTYAEMGIDGVSDEIWCNYQDS